jgi:hypothetical protein
VTDASIVATSERGWMRAVGLLAVVFSFSVLRPAVLLAVPTLLLLLVRRQRGGAIFAVAVLATLVLIAGARDSAWFAERAWSLVVAGGFVALTLSVPDWRWSSRAISSVLAAFAIGAVYFLVRDGAWGALDWTISSGVMVSVTTTLDALALLRDGQPMSPAFVATMYEMAEAQASVFPALLGIASMAALGVAWWLTGRLAGAADRGIGTAASFRFNDHLVWIMIGGLVLVVARWGDAVSRIGANAVVFMGALYALRGAGIVMFLSGGLSVAAYVLLAMGLLLAAPAVLGAAILIGIGDTWLDVRSRTSEPAA